MEGEGAMKFSKALAGTLGRVDQENWKGRLDALHGQQGTWKKVAEHLGVDKRTVERWRFGYTDKHGNRRQVSDKTVRDSAVPKVRAGWKGDRKAQLQAVNWRDLFIVAEMQTSGTPARKQNMHVGHYMEPEDIAAIGNAYLAGDAAGVDAAMDRFLSDGYTQTGDARLGSVDKLEF